MAIEQKDVLEWVNKYAGVIAENRQYLIDLDSPIGDADHGENMNRGFQAALKKMPEVAENLHDGLWTKQAEQKLIEKYQNRQKRDD
jgi:dihydroxyacetone kinase-like protein